MTAGEVDWGVTYRRTSGDEYTTGGFSERGARLLVETAAAGPKGWEPVPVRVCVRTCGEWKAVA